MSNRPIVISIAHQKGGVGKSTLAYNLANYFSRKAGNKCAIIDGDHQGTITDLFQGFGNGGVLGGVELISRSSFEKYEELHAKTQYDLLVIDTPPYISNELPDIFKVSDLILVPTKPAVNDFLAIDRTLEFAQQCQANNPHVQVRIVINMVTAGSNFADTIREEVSEKGTAVLQTEIGQRIVFTRHHLETDSIFDTKDKKAQEEIERLANEILELLTPVTNG